MLNEFVNAEVCARTRIRTDTSGDGCVVGGGGIYGYFLIA
jgi:hypothetical protein